MESKTRLLDQMRAVLRLKQGATASCTLYASQTPLKWWYRLGCVA
jgi:hypothetical protein